MPDEEAAHRVVISWQEEPKAVAKQATRTISDTSIVFEQGDPAGGHMVLRGQDLQSAVHLVDYLLDLTNAPLHGRAPIEVLFTVLRREWEGMRVMRQLAAMSDSEAATGPERPRNPHVHDEPAWAQKIHRMVRPNTGGQSDISGPLQIFWNLLLKDLPLPDGQPPI